MSEPRTFKEAQRAYDALVKAQDVARMQHEHKLRAEFESGQINAADCIAARKAFLNAQEAEAAEQHVWIERLKFEV